MGVCLALAGCASGQTSGANKPALPTTLAPTATATADALKTPLPGQGWVTEPSLNFAKNIAFALSDPLTGYACGNIGVENVNASSFPADALELSVTHDGGRIWSAPVKTSVPGADCNLSINPTNPLDLVMGAEDCYATCLPEPSPYRSHDGGKTWTALTYDPAQWQNIPYHVVSMPQWTTWIGNTVYFAVTQGSGRPSPLPRPQHAFVSNTSGSVLTATSDAIYSAITDPNVWPQDIWAHGSMLVERLRDISNGATYFVDSTDRGSTWSLFQPSAPISLQIASFINGTMAIVYPSGSELDVLLSQDGGLTWKLLTRQAPGQTNSGAACIAAADGSALVADPGSGLWLLEPGASAWKNVAPPIATLVDTPDVLAFSTDMAGHPLLAWSQTSMTQPGIAYHGLG